jgi:uncharacterized protein (TIGR00162 family)
MVCKIQIIEKPDLNDPVLIEGLPGIGFVANMAALHLINKLKTKLFARIISASFQDFAVAKENGDAVSPVNELYYYKREDGGRDLIIWYGNTQALTTTGQYELVGTILNLVKDFGCRFVISIGGFKKDEIRNDPVIYAAATDLKTMKEALDLGTKVMVGHIFGIAGILIGLAKLRNFKGFSILVETLGMHPDAKATLCALSTLGKYLNLNIDLSKIEVTADQTNKALESFGLIKNIAEEKKKEEQEMRWFI